ncbi:MAG: ferritin family protein [Deltaproteobacteria bacterium]|nr:ferritin family protein [Deltaproteobacteria bacterium]
MSFDFTASDVMDMAIEIEKNGASFYRESADMFPGSESEKLLLDLAAMEDEHEKRFEEMKKSLSETERSATVFDPDNESLQYLKALADLRVFYDKKRPGESLIEILKSAIEAEKESMVFYLGMKDMVPEKYGRQRIDDIIREEMGHITLLSGHMLKIK